MSVIKSDSPTVAKVREIAEPMCEELGLYLWDVRYEKEGASWYLRIIIDKDGGVDMNDCEALHRPLSDKLDELDPIKQSYIFEVSSPGLGRELRRLDHFEVCIGDPIRIRFIRPRDGEKEILRVLTGYDKDGITVIDENEQEEKISFEECAKITLFDDDDLELD
ncbi:MAG: ribosome maturation factor RimP [Oscillospiraceae bacterium]|nr:ribosome maturation factor RimP [Oscillospiraceae bacterium]